MSEKFFVVGVLDSDQVAELLKKGSPILRISIHPNEVEASEKAMGELCRSVAREPHYNIILRVQHGYFVQMELETKGLRS